MWQAILTFFFPHCEGSRNPNVFLCAIHPDRTTLAQILLGHSTAIRTKWTTKPGWFSDYDYTWLFLTTLPKFSMSDEGLAHRLPPSHFTAGIQSFLLCNLDFNITINFSNQITDGTCRSWISDQTLWLSLLEERKHRCGPCCGLYRC